ncbi:uncharacterized protein [Antedon mediterranea]|uniref:uncharacterized protein n=1 Tax=Antedon mediterranea TaxID=105859 RepID=UPI003AF66D4E
MYRPPYADGSDDVYKHFYGNGPIGLTNRPNCYRRRQVRGRRGTLNHNQTRPVHPRTGRSNSATNYSNKASSSRPGAHVNTTNNNATSQIRPLCKTTSGVTVINKVQVQDSKLPKQQHIPSENIDFEKVILGPGQPTEVSNIQLNIRTTIQREDNDEETKSQRKSRENNGDCLDRVGNHRKLNHSNGVTEKSNETKFFKISPERIQNQGQTSSFNEIFYSLEKSRLANPPSLSDNNRTTSLNKLSDDSSNGKEESILSTDSIPPLIDVIEQADTIPPGYNEYNLIRETANLNIDGPETSGVGLRSHSLAGIIENSTNINDAACDASQPTEERDIPPVSEKISDKQFLNEDETADKSLGQIISNDPALIVASINGNVFSQHLEEVNKHVLDPSMKTTSHYQTNPTHLMEQLTIIKMHRDIAVDTLEDKKTEVSRLWERLDKVKAASDRLLLSNNELCTERDSLKTQLELRIAEKETAENKETFNETLPQVPEVTTNTVEIQTDSVKDETAVEKEALRLRVVQLQNVVSHKDNRIRVIADNANRTNQKLRHEVEQLRKKLANAERQQCVANRIMIAGPPCNGRADICERTDRRDKLIAELPRWNYINPCDLNPIIRLGNNDPVVIGRGVFGKVELMQFLPTRTLVAVKTVYLDANAPDKTRNHIRQKFQCEVRAMQLTSTHYAFPFLIGVVDEGHPLRLVAMFLGDHKTLESKTISRFLKSAENGITNVQWLNIVLDVVLGVKFLHKNHLLHNDLKGDNILVVFADCRWAGRIIDLGQVSSLNHPQEYRLCEEEKARFRKNHTHIAPELVSGTHKESTASDIFQIGLIVKEIGSKRNMTFLESLGDSCINKDPYRRPRITDILGHVAFDELKVAHNHNEMRM